MATGLLRPSDIGPADAARILSFLNAVTDAAALAETVGFSDGLSAGTRVGAEIIATRATGHLSTLDQLLAITGVTLPRFTEIAISLSAARPPEAEAILRFLPTKPMPWLGQTVPITVQVTDLDGRGVLDQHITLMASDGDLSTRIGLEAQRGRALTQKPELGGLVHVSYGPHLTPRLTQAEATALAPELGLLEERSRTPQDARKSLRAFAARYRGQGSATLQKAVDRLFAAFRPENLPQSVLWPVQQVTVLAMLQDDTGRVTQVASLAFPVRNWLGGFYGALQEEVTGNSLLSAALKNLSEDAEAGRDLSRQIIQATQGFAALERGVLGRSLRDSTTGRNVNAFLEENTANLKGDAIVNTVRAAGASEAAIAAGGFRIFDAIRSVQQIEDVVKIPTSKGGITREDLLPFDNRLAQLEETTVTRGDLTRFGRDLTTALDTRVAALEETTLRQADLDIFRRGIVGEFDSKLDDFRGNVVTPQQLNTMRTEIDTAMDARLDKQLTQDAFDARLADLEKTIGARLDTIERESVRTDQFESLRIELKADIDTRMAGQMDRREFDARLSQVQADIANALRTKANASSVSSLRTSVNKMTDAQTKLDEDMKALDRKVAGNGPGLRR